MKVTRKDANRNLRALHTQTYVGHAREISVCGTCWLSASLARVTPVSLHVYTVLAYITVCTLSPARGVNSPPKSPSLSFCIEGT